MKLTINVIMMLLLFVCSATISAQTNEKGYMVAGTVMDEKGETIIGASITVDKDRSKGTATDLDGKFRLQGLFKGEVLTVTFIGYKPYSYKVTMSKENIKIVLEPQVSDLDEVVIVGEGSQKKISLTGAVTTIEPAALDVPATSVSNMLGGNVPGIIAVTRSGEPGSDFSEFWVRGIGTFGANSSALILIDGVEGDMNQLDPADIESFSVLKDASATAIYGARGANGVVVVKTKQGKAGKLRINYKSSITLSESARMPEYCDAYTYALLANEAKLSRGDDPLYSALQLRLFQTGLDPDLAPNTNWRDVILRDRVWQNQHYFSVSGGGTNARYFMSLSMQNKDAVFRPDKSANKYDPNINYQKYSFLTKVDANLTKKTRLGLKLYQVMTNQNSPGLGNNSALWNAQAALTPVSLPVKYSTGQLASKGANAESGYELLSPYVQLNYTGFTETRNLTTNLMVDLSQDLDFITKGLKVRGLFSFTTNSEFYTTRSKMPDLYWANGRNAQGTLVMTKQVEKKDLSLSRSTDTDRTYYWQLNADYDRTFGDHAISGLLHFYLQSRTKSKDSDEDKNVSAVLKPIPRRYEALSGRVTYNYKQIYFAEFNIGYTGSEQFPKNKRFGFFPAVSGGWIPSQYACLQEALPFLDYLKIRASYGLVGNDRIGGTRFPYLTTVTSTGDGGWGTGGIREGQLGTDGLVWEKAKKFDVGVDINLFNNKFSLTVDYFKDRRTDIFQQRVTVPEEAGFISMPWANTGSMESWGMDGNFSFKQDFGKNWRATIRGNFTFSRNKVLHYEESDIHYPYQSRIGYSSGVQRGYIAEGLFRDWEDIESSPKQNFESKVYPGDIKYVDVNADGVIDVDDRVPLSFSNVPEIQYGFAGEVSWKNLTLGMLFEGTGHSTYFLGGTGYYPFSGGSTGNLLTIVADQNNRWTPREISGTAATENPNARFPRMTYGSNKNNNQASTYWLADNSYLRFKELNIRYTYRNPWLQNVLGVSSMSLSFIMHNICTWDSIKLWDPGQASANGAAYPIQRTYSMQLSLNF